MGTRARSCSWRLFDSGRRLALDLLGHHYSGIPFHAETREEVHILIFDSQEPFHQSRL
jgi:hypothetical protein